MASNIPIILDDTPPGDVDRDLLRAAIITALDALRCYQKMACMADDERIRKILVEGAREAKGRVQELGTILLRGRENAGNEDEPHKDQHINHVTGNMRPWRR